MENSNIMFTLSLVIVLFADLVKLFVELYHKYIILLDQLNNIFYYLYNNVNEFRIMGFMNL